MQSKKRRTLATSITLRWQSWNGGNWTKRENKGGVVRKVKDTAAWDAECCWGTTRVIIMNDAEFKRAMGEEMERSLPRPPQRHVVSTF